MWTADNEFQVLEAPERLDAESRLEFRQAALDRLEHVAQHTGTRLTIDFLRTTLVDATGIGILVFLQKRARERSIAIRLTHVPPVVKQILELTNLGHLFQIEG